MLHVSQILGRSVTLFLITLRLIRNIFQVSVFVCAMIVSMSGVMHLNKLFVMVVRADGAMMILIMVVNEELLVLVIENSGEGTTESGATNVHPHVVSHNAAWVLTVA